MKRRVVATDGFDRTVAAQIDHLIAEERPSWVHLLLEDIGKAHSLLAEFPASGQLVERRPGAEIRRVQLRQTPFRVWYRIDVQDETAPVVLVRLFHVRQRAEMT